LRKQKNSSVCLPIERLETQPEKDISEVFDSLESDIADSVSKTISKYRQSTIKELSRNKKNEMSIPFGYRTSKNKVELDKAKNGSKLINKNSVLSKYITFKTSDAEIKRISHCPPKIPTLKVSKKFVKRRRERVSTSKSKKRSSWSLPLKHPSIRRAIQSAKPRERQSKPPRTLYSSL
jgi:N-acetylmuramoyl-L-alanine amidase CwlA